MENGLNSNPCQMDMWQAKTNCKLSVFVAHDFWLIQCSMDTAQVICIPILIICYIFIFIIMFDMYYV